MEMVCVYVCVCMCVYERVWADWRENCMMTKMALKSMEEWHGDNEEKKIWLIFL